MAMSFTDLNDQGDSQQLSYLHFGRDSLMFAQVITI